jgi:hypothetical protein
MTYTFKYEKIIFGRTFIGCVEIPEIHTEQIGLDPLLVMQDAYDALNMYISIALLTGEPLASPKNDSVEEIGYFRVNVSEINFNKLKQYFEDRRFAHAV